MNKAQLKIPKHIAIVMDGNSRWAKKHGKLQSSGHKKGAEVSKLIAEACQELGVKYLTLYAFSTENWNRSKAEVKVLMNLLRNYLKKDFNELIKRNVRLRFIGDLSRLDVDIQQLIENAEEKSKDNSFTLIIALSYGSRDEIRSAAYKMAEHVLMNGDTLDEVQPADFDQFLYTSGIPDPDLFIRTSGEHRISNFLLWQLSYSELYFTDVLWPDFDKKELIKAIDEFSKRERRYGLRG